MTIPTVADRLAAARNAVKILHLSLFVEDPEDLTNEEGIQALTDRAAAALEQLRALETLPAAMLRTPAP